MVHHVVYGITQDQETKNYMVVWNELCKKCNCICNAMHFKRNFENWTSNNNDIDKFIQDSQLLEHTENVENALEWIPYDRFHSIKFIAKGKLYRANWINGKIVKWDNENQNWKRENPNMFVILKSLNNLTDFTSELINNEVL